MYLKILLLLIVFVSNNLFSQTLYIQNYIETKNTILLPKKFNDDTKIRISLNENNEVFLLYTELRSEKEIHYLELSDVTNNAVYQIIIPDSIASKDIFISDFAISGDYLSLVIHNRYFIILHRSGLAFENIFILNEINYSNTKFLGTNVVAYTSNIYTGTKILKLNLENLSDYVEHDFQNPVGIEFTYFQPKNLMDMNDSLIVVANLLNYRIYFYNWNFEKVDSIMLYIPKWQHIEDDEQIDIGNRIDLANSKDKIETLRPYLKGSSMIHKVHFLNNNKILVLWSSPSSNKLYEFHFVIHERNHKKWVNTDVYLRNNPLNEKNNMSEILNRWNISNMFDVENGNILLLEPIPFELTPEINKLSISELKNKIDSYYIENELRYTLIKMGLKQ